VIGLHRRDDREDEAVNATNLRWGMMRGLFFGIFYSVFALIVYLFRGADAFNAYGLTLGSLVAAYALGGLISGAVVGALRPLTRWYAGHIVIGVAATIPAMLGVGLAMYGAFSRWTSEDVGSVVMAIVVLGPLFGHQEAKMNEADR
jgi:hypothetical protein